MDILILTRRALHKGTENEEGSGFMSFEADNLDASKIKQIFRQPDAMENALTIYTLCKRCFRPAAAF